MGVFKEKNYQSFILKYLTEKQGWEERKDANFDRSRAMDCELVIRFLKATQPEKYDAVVKLYKAKADRVILDALNTQLIGDGVVSVLKNGFTVDDVKFDTRAVKPDVPYNKKAWADYRANVFSVAQEVWASDKERIDLVLFLNGIAIMAVELKDNIAGQNYEDAKNQWKTSRSPKTRLFMPKGGVLVMFAVDHEQVWMTTKLNGKATYFLPFNQGSQGNGETDIDCGAGNPTPPSGKYPVHYFWEETLAKDKLLEIIDGFVFIEHGADTDESGKKYYFENIIFPRYHQVDVVTKLVQDVSENHTKRNYLIQHSAGSGKTSSITWLAFHLTRLVEHTPAPGEVVDRIFDHVIVMTDRRVVVRQLKDALKQFENSPGYVKSITDDDPSSELANAFAQKKRIIVTTIQRFAYIQDLVSDMSDKRFAVIIDEAHSSTKGKSMVKVKRILGKDFNKNDSPEVQMHKLMAKQAKQKNVSMFAFTATPRAETIQLFGQHAEGARKGVFHCYPMKQAIEEKFIVDVLKNYTEYKTLYTIIKKTEDDPVYKLKKAKSQIAAFALSSPETVKERTKIIVAHFVENYAGRLGGNSRAMVVTSSRQEAVAYWEAINAELKVQGKDYIKAIVAFSGSLTYKGKKVVEHNLNGFSEDALPKEFRKPANRILVVADKYQTGFDEKRLQFMYVMKKLHDIAAVQTLSRLNRIYPPYDKEVFVLDFTNTADEIARSFAPYYRSTMLNNSASPAQLLEASAHLDEFDIFDDDLCNDYWTAVCKRDEPSATVIMLKVVKRFEKLKEADQDECRMWLAKFDTLYPFVAQAIGLKDSSLFLRDQLIHPLLRRLQHEPEVPIDLRDKIAVKDVEVKKAAEKGVIPGGSKGVNLPKPKPKDKGEDLLARLSAIIEEMNSENGTDHSPESGAQSCMLIHNQMLHDKKLMAIVGAKANSYNDFEQEAAKIFEKLVQQAYTENDEFLKFIIGNHGAMKAIFRGLVKDVYKEMHKSDPEYRMVLVPTEWREAAHRPKDGYVAD